MKNVFFLTEDDTEVIIVGTIVVEIQLFRIKEVYIWHHVNTDLQLGLSKFPLCFIAYTSTLPLFYRKYMQVVCFT